jgi:hypothetical protein
MRTGNVPLVVAGGGGGASAYSSFSGNGQNASVTTNGLDSGTNLGGTGGAGGAGGGGEGGGGAGYLSNGADGGQQAQVAEDRLKLLRVDPLILLKVAQHVMVVLVAVAVAVMIWVAVAVVIAVVQHKTAQLRVLVVADHTVFLPDLPLLFAPHMEMVLLKSFGKLFLKYTIKAR